MTTVLTQVPVDTWVAIDAIAVVKGLTDACQQDLVRQCTLGLWIGLPGVIAASLDLENAAHAVELERALVLGHKYVLHPDSLAKYVAAFFRLSCSSSCQFFLRQTARRPTCRSDCSETRNS